MKLIWYGERGVVNAIVTHLATLPDGAKQFLKCVIWAGGPSPAWIETIDDDKSFCIVELGLNDFGNPDLMIICRCHGNERPYCVFVEAKVTCYEDGVVPNSLGMTRKGFNSGCNGQLSLKYRFSKALEAWDGRGPIVESREMHAAYQRPTSQGGLADPQPVPRQLSKRLILDMLSELLKPDPALDPAKRGPALDPAQFHFVMLTWDKEFPFTTGEKDCLPLFCDESGRDVWDDVKQRFGWLGYQHLANDPRLLNAFGPSLKLMVGEHLQPETSMEIGGTATRGFRSQARICNLQNAKLKELMSSIEEWAITMFGHHRVGGPNQKKRTIPGSISVVGEIPTLNLAGDRTIVKVVPYHRTDGQDVIRLGLRPHLPLLDWAGRDRVKDIGAWNFQGEEFRWVELTDLDTALEIILSVFEELKDYEEGG